MPGSTIPQQKYVTALLGGILLFALYLTSRHSYLLFHVLIEMFSVVVACCIFVIAWNSRRIIANQYFLFIGIASLFVGVVELLHAISFKGMGVFPGHGPNLPTQLWVVARLLQATSLLAAPLFLGRRLRPGLVLVAYLSVTILLLASIFGGAFPACFVEGEGLTPFKKACEYLVVLMFLGAIVLLRRKIKEFDRDVARTLITAIIVLIAAELAFTLYTDVYDISNMAGHLLTFIGIYLIYKALIETGLARPYNLLFRELKKGREEIAALNADLAAYAVKLEETNCELEVTLDELATSNQELAATNSELTAANQDLEAFNYTVSHDLRTPLTCITGYCQLLSELNRPNLGEQDKFFVEQIHASAARMEQLITTLLDFSRLTCKELKLETVDLGKLARAVSLDIRMSNPGRAVTFEITENAQVSCDVKLLHVVLENLLGNAWKYTARTGDAVIEFGTMEHEGKRAYFVRDNGIGFDMALSDKLFAAFQRLHDDQEFRGTGIGLATVQKIIQRHGGEVWAESSPGKGATFYFTLG